MSEEQKEPEKKQPSLGEALAGLTAVIVVLGLILFFVFWPWSTEGQIDRVQYTNWNNSAIVTFDDGRTINLRGQPSRSLVVGKYYRITYNNLKYFYSVEEVERKD